MVTTEGKPTIGSVMILIELLAHSPWPVWLAVVMLVAAADLSALALEWSRRRTYKSVLAAVSDGTLLMDRSRRGRTLLVARVADHCGPDEVKRGRSEA